APPALPAQTGEGDPSLSGTVRDAEGQPIAGVLVALDRIPPFGADSLFNLAAAVDTLRAGASGRAIYGRDSTGGRFLYAFRDTLRTGADGRFAWHGLDEEAGYTLVALKPGFEFGSRQGLASLGGWQASLPGARTFDFTGRPHRLTLLDRGTFDRLKPHLTARTPEAYRRGVLVALALFFGAFWLVHLGWSFRKFDGDGILLPVLHLLSGLSLLVMLSLPDPLRDRDLAGGTAQGIAAGVVLLGLLALWDVRRLQGLPVRLVSRLRGHRASPRLLAFVKQGYPWLILGGLGLGLVLALGRGPEGSGVKVNLGFFQPSEAIKLLLLLFVASYLAENGEYLRRLNRRRRLLYGLGLAGGVAGVMVLYALQGDLGPALVLAVTLVALYAIAQGRPWPVVLGVLGIAAGFFLGAAAVPRVGDRVAMFLSPWDNHAATGGDHLAHALWSLATGGLTGQGLGEGAPATTPEAHTDMVLPSLGEELGLVGLAAVLLLYLVLLHRGLLIALRSGHPFGFYLGAGIAVATGVQLVL
ncbi:MAG TPA: FtsW/RodA/SpoVE family cell cycle protein, partial [Anaeromyxobacteraceae bacterium]|nr:FtsW/RodA/SpoVE family cell cycle protein [Anaeromyxobacteraceae bacterium]